MKKGFSKLFLGFVLLFFCYSSVFASVDISLEDDTTNKEMSIVIDSGEEYVDGVDLSIIVSDDITINEEDLPESIDACTLSGGISFSDNRLYLECFNDSGTKMSGTIATIPYFTESTDYYFYVDTSSLDLGNEDLGIVTNINYSNEAVDDTTEETTVFDNIINFISDNFLYVIGGAVLLIVVTILIMTLSSKTKIEEVPVVANSSVIENPTQEENTGQPKEDSI